MDEETGLEKAFDARSRRELFPAWAHTNTAATRGE